MIILDVISIHLNRVFWHVERICANILTFPMFSSIPQTPPTNCVYLAEFDLSAAALLDQVLQLITDVFLSAAHFLKGLCPAVCLGPLSPETRKDAPGHLHEAEQVMFLSRRILQLMVLYFLEESAFLFSPSVLFGLETCSG